MLLLKTLALLAAAVTVTGQSIDSLPECSVSALTFSSPCHLTPKGRGIHVLNVTARLSSFSAVLCLKPD